MDELGASDCFAEAGLQVRPAVLSADALKLIQDYCRIKRSAIKPLYEDSLCPQAYSIYADIMSEALSSTLRPLVEQVSGSSLVSTFSYLRVYERGCSFARHVDRVACEVSASITVECSAPEGWPLMFDVGGTPTAIVLAPGDLVVYRGSTITHWRDPFPGDYQAQLILNYVAEGGAYADWAYDRRPSLGFPISARTLSLPKLTGGTASDQSETK